MAALPKKPPADSASVPFDTLIAWVFRSGSGVYLSDDNDLRVKMGEGAPTWLKGVIDAHADRLLLLVKCRALDAHIERRMYQWRETQDADLRRRGHVYICAKVDELANLSGSAEGYHDPASLFSHSCVEDYRRLLETDLTVDNVKVLSYS